MGHGIAVVVLLGLCLCGSPSLGFAAVLAIRQKFFNSPAGRLSWKILILFGSYSIIWVASLTECIRWLEH